MTEEHIAYIHLFDSKYNTRLTGPLAFSRFPYRDELIDTARRTRHQHNHPGFGGITIRVNHVRQNMVVSLCSFKDQYGRKLGRLRTTARALVIEPARFRVVIPKVRETSAMFYLQAYAAYECYRMWMDFGWPIEDFEVNFCI